MRTPEQRVYDGDLARQVLDNEAFSAAFADIKQELTDQWQNSPARDLEGREKLYQLLKLTDKLEATLRKSLSDGTMARAQLQHERSLLQRAKESIGLT